MTDAEFNDYAKALADAGVDTKALLYMKRWKSLMKVRTSVYVCFTEGHVNIMAFLFCNFMICCYNDQA